jgi:hypothetical protein
LKEALMKTVSEIDRSLAVAEEVLARFDREACRGPRRN